MGTRLITPGISESLTVVLGHVLVCVCVSVCFYTDEGVPQTDRGKEKL